ncbi:Protocatechuate 3 4-dioxygenase beta subunit [Ceratocystis platani]|uniref:Protocatechuate 3 4-dioxygenase beta subunit n=1 Tax=Ceratocystis fimbriata f. sp. platani TaxID=88771 RepID=A0A0F8DCU9_CERFI|nr:Protocatechuate 3 4-dioxygenase beta subunit [Ceratocystis platani]
MVEMFGSAGVCPMTPETDIGPLYKGSQQIRSDLRDNEPGVPIHLEVQIVDMRTCLPVPDAYVDFWATNASGVYSAISGFVRNGDDSDTTLADKHFARGIQPTDENGIAHFIVNVPGHYVGRTTHMHVGVHHDVQIMDDGTIKGGHVSHIGQIYMDQTLLRSVELIDPYNKNMMPWTTNVEDPHFLYAATGGDPVMRYSLLGDHLEQGMYGWIRLAVDLEARRPMPGHPEKRSEPTPRARKDPSELPLPVAMPKMYFYGSNTMPQDLNARDNAEESQEGENKDKDKGKEKDKEATCKAANDSAAP